MKNKQTLWTLLNNQANPKGIEIPMIQRDYAQGRENKVVSNLRKTFLKDIRKKTEAYLNGEISQKIELDFIYGSLENSKFIPLDGQQRLTTLYLLNFYLSIRDRNWASESHVFKKFTYQTRTSSKDFCSHLTDRKTFETLEAAFLLSEDKQSLNLSKIIKDQHWYFLAWNHDPTIQSMLVMLDEIHREFFASKITFEKLIDANEELISFYQLNIETYGLSDSLYIKMNARGKVLSDFENFKAKFQNCFREKHPALIKEFSDKIDGIWCDMMWDFTKPTELDGTMEKSNLVDVPLLNFIQFVSEMLYYHSGVDSEQDFHFDFELIEKVYQLEDNLRFLIDSFDLFYNLGIKDHLKKIDLTFEMIFSDSYVPGKVSLFEPNVNLFRRCIFKTSFDIREKLMLYSLLLYGTKQNSSIEVTTNLKDYLRICRNYIFNINQFQKDTVGSNLRKENYAAICKTLEEFYEEKDVYTKLLSENFEVNFYKLYVKHEKEKALLFNSKPELKELIHKLEDHNHLKGALYNLPINDTIENIQALVDNFYEIWEERFDGQIARALLAIGDYSIHVGGSNLGGIHFFGKKDKWNRILVARDKNSGYNEKIKNVLDQFFKEIRSIEGSMVQRFTTLKRKANVNELWRKLFIDNSIIWKGGSNNFSFYSDEDNDLRIEKLNGTNVLGIHKNAILEIIFNKITEQGIEIEFKEARYSEQSYLLLKTTIRVYAHRGAFQFENIDIKNDHSHLLNQFSVVELTPTSYKLIIGNNDNLETVLNFINKIL
ncbi:uncharacterized protein DUF262 [Salegentibacter sp. 24]|uniref:DUF262 domain-containing protein n=1 Tax=Salegentibacter sp. 24 TaxID=2183986 RepID=UPI0010611C9A|nr:DUF262 domain-containing protein [Salegentibacter sp. 24]TDN87101.1 uncharacterized protein DUF262 [Salegentibacter sp. 24]